MWFFSDEHRMLQETVRAFARAELAPKIEQLDHLEAFNQEAFKKMGELGLHGVLIPEDQGGTGLDAVAATICMEENGRSGCLNHSLLSGPRHPLSEPNCREWLQ